MQELPRSDAETRRTVAKEVVSRAMTVRPHITMSQGDVNVVLGLYTRNVHAHPSRFGTISGTEETALLYDLIPFCSQALKPQRLKLLS